MNEISLTSLLKEKKPDSNNVIHNSSLETQERYFLDFKSYRCEQFSKFNYLANNTETMQ